MHAPNPGLILSFTPLANRHLDAVVAIDAEGVPPYWEKAQFRKSNRQGNYHSYVLEVGPDETGVYAVVGFIAIEALGRRINLLNIGVAKKERRKGHGRTLITGLRTRFPNCAIHAMSYEQNLEFQLFLKACSFVCSAIVKSDTDTYLFEMPVDAIG